MSRFHSGAALAALNFAASLGAAGLATATSADAQTYNRLVVFGDSLSDNGNLFIATGGTQPPSPPYFQGHFSSGPTFVELLGFTLGRYAAGAPVTGDIDYAFGGARTDSSASPPGMRLQLAAYTAAGGRFGSGDLVSILGGANNIFQGLPAAGASASPVTAITPVALSAAADITAITGSIAGAGAGTILVTNLPKLSLTPQFRNTAAAPLADFAVTTFNAALLSGVSGVAAARPGANIIVMDLFKIGDTISANPGRFGITNVTTACFNGVTVCTDPGNFYFDGVHPTALGHRIIAQLANDYLYYGSIGGQSTLLGETAFRHREESLDANLDGLSGKAPWEAGTRLSVTAAGDRTDTDARGAVGEAQSDGYGVRMALETGPSEHWRIGGAGTYRHADVDGSTLTFDLETFGIDLYGGWRSGGTFVTASVGAANESFDIERLTSVAPIVHTATTEGRSMGGKVQAGTWFDLGGLSLSPRAGITWASSEISAFHEQGPAAEYRYRSRTVEAINAEISLRAEARMGPFAVFAEGGYRDSLDDRSDAVQVGIVNNPAKVLSTDFDDPFGGQVLASAGVRGSVGPVLVDLAYRGRFGDSADSHMGGITLTLPLQ